MAADIYRRCGCRDETGKAFRVLPANAKAEDKTAACPKLVNDPKHGSWGYAVTGGYDPATGKRIQARRMGFATKAEAQKKRAEAVTEISSGKWKGHQTVTVGSYLPSWLERRISDGLRPSTTKMYRSYITNDLVPALGLVRLAELRRAQVDKFIQDLLKAGRGATTVRRIHATLSSALAAAQRLDLVDINAASNIALPTVTKNIARVWEPEEANAFLAAVEPHRLGVMFEVEIRSGLRRGELCGLRWSDVDLVRRELVARVQLTQIAGQVIEGPIKTSAGQDRAVSLDDAAIGALMAWKLQQDQERDEAGSAYQESGRVFTYEDGRQLRPAYVSRLFDTVIENAKLRDIRFHDLRHLHASLMIAEGVPLAVVSKRLGHSTIAVTVDLYGHLLRDANRQAAEAAGNLLARSSAHKVHTK
jgi:integrase